MPGTYLILMRRFGAEMYVPPAKLQAYLEDGWTEIERKQTEDEPAAPAASVAAEGPAPVAPMKPSVPVKRSRSK